MNWKLQEYFPLYLSSLNDVTFILLKYTIYLVILAGHVHITDFNIATLLTDGQLATSMSGTTPYMGWYLINITDFNIATLLTDGQLATSMSGTTPYMGW